VLDQYQTDFETLTGVNEMTQRQADALIRIVSPEADNPDSDFDTMADENIHTLCKFLHRCMVCIEELRDSGIGGDVDFERWDRAVGKADELLNEWSGNDNPVESSEVAQTLSET
jgi:hypothetical protein